MDGQGSPEPGVELRIKGDQGMSRRIVVLVAMACALWGLSWRPAQAYVGISVGIGGPGFGVSFGENLNAYYAPAYSTYVYADGGLYYRWVDGGWVYSRAFVGPWWPLTPAVFLPPLLLYGPPPPVVTYRPYFLWWRMRVAPWYAQAHPVWWMRHRMFMAHYGLWRTRIVPFYEAHPGLLWRRPVGRVVFTRPFIRRQMFRYTLHHPEFAAHHPLMRRQAMRYSYAHPGFARRGPLMPQRRYMRPGPRMPQRPYRRFVGRHPRFVGHPRMGHRAFRGRRDYGRGRP